MKKVDRSNRKYDLKIDLPLPYANYSTTSTCVEFNQRGHDVLLIRLTQISLLKSFGISCLTPCPVDQVDDTSNDAIPRTTGMEAKRESGESSSSSLNIEEGGLIELPQQDKPFAGSKQVCEWMRPHVLLDLNNDLTCCWCWFWFWFWFWFYLEFHWRL